MAETSTVQDREMLVLELNLREDSLAGYYHLLLVHSHSRSAVTSGSIRTESEGEIDAQLAEYVAI
jgi:hypothetical protein